MNAEHHTGRGVDRCERRLVQTVVSAYTDRRDARVMAPRYGVLTGPVTAIDDDTFTLVEHGTPITVDWTDLVAADAA